MYGQAFGLTGVSPKTRACFASTGGVVAYFIHLYAQFGCGAFLASIHVSAQPVAPTDGMTSFTGTFFACSASVSTGQMAASDEFPLVLEKGDRRVELLLVQLVRILDPEIRLRVLQVERPVRDLDRIVRDRDLALVLRVVERRPAGRARLDLLRVVEEDVRPPLDRNAVVDAVDGVVRRRLEDRDEVVQAR